MATYRRCRCTHTRSAHPSDGSCSCCSSCAAYTPPTAASGDMRISHEPPPLIDRLRAAFAITDQAMFTFGDVVHVPSGVRDLPPDLWIHERIHRRQQGANPLAWWERYLADAAWRIEQEAQAYRAQLTTLFAMHADPDERLRHAVALADALASPQYGSAVSFAEAYQRITGQRIAA